MGASGIEILIIGVCLVGPIIGYIVWKARRDIAAHNWPTVEATIQSADIEEVGIRYKVPLPCFAFSYVIEGDYHSGRFALSVGGQQADGSLKELIGRKLTVHYDPKCPSSFYIPDEFIEGYDVRVDV
jgi:hypothetical protein